MDASNPIQQRIEIISDKWTVAKTIKGINIIRISSQDDETDMIDTFYDYMIGTNTDIEDIAFHFESTCGNDLHLFSTNLLAELEAYISIWNTSAKPDDPDAEAINWKPDYTLADKKNAAALFILNINKLELVLDIDEDLFVVAIFKSDVLTTSFNGWLINAVKVGISKKVKFLVADSVGSPIFSSFAKQFPTCIHTININLDMPNALAQIAAMGNPQEPAVQYRMSFVKMMNAIGKRNEKEAENSGADCIKIARLAMQKDPYWIAQLVAINLCIGNDKMGYKNYESAQIYADRSLLIAEEAVIIIGQEVSDSLKAQSLMFRGTVCFLIKNYKFAQEDFKMAAAIFISENNLPLAIEAYRMAGNSAIKGGDKIKAAEILSIGALLGENFERDIAVSTTYGGLLQLFIMLDFKKYIPFDRLNNMCMRLFGKDWIWVVKDWGKLPDRQSIIENDILIEAE